MQAGGCGGRLRHLDQAQGGVSLQPQLDARHSHQRWIGAPPAQLHGCLGGPQATGQVLQLQRELAPGEGLQLLTLYGAINASAHVMLSPPIQQAHSTHSTACLCACLMSLILLFALHCHVVALHIWRCVVQAAGRDAPLVCVAGHHRLAQHPVFTDDARA